MKGFRGVKRGVRGLRVWGVGRGMRVRTMGV